MEFLKPLRIVMAIGSSIFFGSFSFADHPNEGSGALASLIEEALKNNLEIQEAEKQYESSLASRKQAAAPYLPELSVEGGYQDSKIDGETSSGSFGYGRAAINLYRGGKDQANLSARSEEEKFQRFRFEKSKVQIEREVSKKYYELLYLQEGIAVNEEALKVNRSQSSLAVKKKSAGYTSQADVLEFELREATLFSDINFLKREESTKQRELRGLLGRVDESTIRVAGHLGREPFNKDGDVLLQIALQERIDLKEAVKDIAVSSFQYKALFADYLPKIDLEGKYGKLSGQERNNNSVVKLQVSVPLFSGMDTLHGRQAKSLEVANNDLRATRIRQEIKIQLENAVARLRSIDERLNLEEKNIERSKRYYTITLDEYKKGVKNSPDVAGAAERLFDARLRNLEFRKEFYLTRVEIAEAVGISSLELVK